jgi:hypothetical protein
MTLIVAGVLYKDKEVVDDGISYRQEVVLTVMLLEEK